MSQVDRIALLRERLAGTRFASDTDHIINVARGQEPLRVGMAVEVERATGKRIAPNGAEYHVRIKASTEAIARDQGIIPIRAWEKGGLKNFAANPIILAYHDHKQPIGRSVHTELSSDSLVEYWEFHCESDISRLMKTLYEKGFMRAASVGFLVHEFSFIDELDDKQLEKLVEQYGAAAVRDIYWIAERAELLETSAVPVPSDATALEFSFAARNAEAMGIDISSIRSITDTPKGENMPGVKPEDAEAAARAAAEAAAAVAAAAGTAADVPAEPTMRDLLGVIKELSGAVAELRTLVEKGAASAAVVTPASSTSAGSESAASIDARETPEDELSIEIEKLDGETDNQAVARYVDETVARLRGAPVPSK